MRLKYTGPARQDLRKISAWIADENPLRAKTFAGELRAACRSVLNFPESNQLLEMARSQTVRRKVYGNYLIFYRVKEQTVEILRILHGAQDYSDLF
jgi:toxin ParE1/3/4